MNWLAHTLLSKRDIDYQLEAEIETASAEVCDPDFYNQDEDIVKNVTSALADLEKQLQAAYDRWDELEAKE